ncbi:hypothetical protein [Agromyces sp. SYSU T00194]|uniref:hypothetical protein n=1 Tax=Agromyces chitinivorans TaxID=3158560 RepID=UPI00339809BB
MTTAPVPAASQVRHEWRPRTSLASRRHWFALLFDAGPITATGFAELAGVRPELAQRWIGEQVGSGVLRVVGFDERLESEVLLPGEHVIAVLGDDGSPALAGARRMAAAHPDRVAPAVRALAGAA